MTQEEIRLSNPERAGSTGSGGSLSQRRHGAPCAKTTAPMGTHGSICLTTTPDHAPTDGTKMAWLESAIGNRNICFALAYGTSATHPERADFRLDGQRGNHGEDVRSTTSTRLEHLRTRT